MKREGMWEIKGNKGSANSGYVPILWYRLHSLSLLLNLGEGNLQLWPLIVWQSSWLTVYHTFNQVIFSEEKSLKFEASTFFPILYQCCSVQYWIYIFALSVQEFRDLIRLIISQSKQSYKFLLCCQISLGFAWIRFDCCLKALLLFIRAIWGHFT